jgi:hypothetical protein
LVLILVALLADQAVVMVRRLELQAAVLSNLAVVAVPAAALPQLTPPKPEGLAVSRAVLLQAPAAVPPRPRSTPARRLLRVLLLPTLRVVVVQAVRLTMPVRVLLAVPELSLAAEAAAVVEAQL